MVRLDIVSWRDGAKIIGAIGQKYIDVNSSRFLFLVFSQVRKFLWAASALAAAIVGPGSPTGRSASGMPSAVFAMTIASRSSVLASPAKSLAAPCAASPGRYAADIPAALERASARAPMLRD